MKQLFEDYCDASYEAIKGRSNSKNWHTFASEHRDRCSGPAY